MEVPNGLVVDAITHAVAAVKRRREGLAALASCHSKASANALKAMTRQAVAASGRSR